MWSSSHIVSWHNLHYLQNPYTVLQKVNKYQHDTKRVHRCVCRVYKTPSYLVQELFSVYQGVRYAKTDVTVTSGEVHEELTAASTTCLDAKCRSIALKVITMMQELLTAAPTPSLNDLC